jgi:N-acetylneuraminate synthase
MNVPAYKIGSGECNNYPLLKHIAAFGKPMILSTGMNTIESVGKAVKIMEDAGVPYALMHTTNLYPTPPHLVRLGAMVELGKAFPQAVVGLSDHTTDNIACLGAVALGASILERHFTDHMYRKGPDIVCSMDEKTCRELIAQSRTLHSELGGSKGPVPEEQVTIDFAFATVVTIAPVKAGEALTRENLWVKRPGTGAIPAERYEEMLGKIARRDIPTDTHLTVDDVS